MSTYEHDKEGALTVAELIEKLKKMPQDALVITSDYDENYFVYGIQEYKNRWCNDELVVEIM